MITELQPTLDKPEGVVAVGLKELLGSTFRIGDEWWMVTTHNRVRLVMKRVWSELHAIRITLGMGQQEMKNRLGISQAQYSRYESGVYTPPDGIMAQARAMMPNGELCHGAASGAPNSNPPASAPLA